MKASFWHVNLYYTDQNKMQSGNLMELKFEDLEIQK